RRPVAVGSWAWSAPAPRSKSLGCATRSVSVLVAGLSSGATTPVPARSRAARSRSVIVILFHGSYFKQLACIPTTGATYTPRTHLSRSVGHGPGRNARREIDHRADRAGSHTPVRCWQRDPGGPQAPAPGPRPDRPGVRAPARRTRDGQHRADVPGP